MELIFIWPIVWLISGLLFGVVSALVASSRSASGWWGFVWGVLLGPLGIVIAFVLKPSKPQVLLVQSVRQETEQGATRVCPHCRSYIPTAATACRYCRRESQAVLQPPPTEELCPARNGEPHVWSKPAFRNIEECATCFKHRPLGG